jgi:hypothetical protein
LFKNAATRIEIRVLDVNDHSPRFSLPEYVFTVSTPRIQPGLKVGAVQAIDKDVTDKLYLSLRGPHAK